MSAPGKHCRNCGVALPYRPTVARGLDRRTLCRSCHRIKQSKLAYASRKKREAPRPFRLGEAQHLVMAGAANRVRADNTLNRGRDAFGLHTQLRGTALKEITCEHRHVFPALP